MIVCKFYSIYIFYKVYFLDILRFLQKLRVFFNLFHFSFYAVNLLLNRIFITNNKQVLYAILYQINFLKKLIINKKTLTSLKLYAKKMSHIMNQYNKDYSITSTLIDGK